MIELRTSKVELPGSAARSLGLPIVALLLAATLAAPSGAQTARWVELPPPPCAGGAFFYDAAHQRVILAGGAVGPEDAGSVWSLTFDGSVHWTLLSTELAPIFSFSGSSVIFDPTRDRLVAYGQRAPLFEKEISTFDLSPGSHSWTSLSTSGIPAIGGEASYAYDPLGDRMIVFGGRFGAFGFGNALTALSFSGTPTWSTLTVPDPKPTGRAGATAVFDPASARILFFGGYDLGSGSGRAFDETWALSLAGSPAWRFLVPEASVPAARARHGAALDPAARRMIVFGGVGLTTLSDAWQLALDVPADSARWNPLPSFFQDRARMAACVDTVNHRFLVYGGDASLGVPSVSYVQTDLWSLNLDIPNSWSQLGGPAAVFPDRSGHASFVDASRSKLAITGGVTGNSNIPLADTWVRPLADDQSGWSVVGGNSAGDRAEAMTVTDPAGDRALLFGGYNLNIPANPYRNDLSALDLAGLSFWSPLTPASPPAERSGSLWVFDPTRRQAILYGGWGQFPNFHPRMFSDSWRFDAATDTWQSLSVGEFGGRADITGIYDPVNDRIVAFGGRDTLAFFNDVHVLPLEPGGVWATLATAGTPPWASPTARAVYDAAGQRMVVIEDADPSGQTPTHLNVWSLTLTDPPTWSQLVPNGRPPGPRSGYTVVMDEPRRRAIVMGGRGLSGHNDTWALYLDETTPVTLSLQGVDAASDRVRIRWFGDGSFGLVSAFKRAAGGSWSALGTLTADGTGAFTLEDRDVTPGGRYDYQIGIVEGGVMRYYGLVSVEVPRVPSLALAGARPSPTPGPLMISFSLASDAPASLEVIDIQGRQTIWEDVGTLGPGAHVLRLEQTRGLASGVYFIMLTQGGRSAIAKAVVAR